MATLKLSKTWPYAYDYQNEQDLIGNPSPLNSQPLLLAP